MLRRNVMRFNTHELAWAAGFFDGEGHTGCRGEGSTVVILAVEQNERAPLERFQRAVRIGRVKGPYRNGTGNAHYRFSVTRYEDVQFIIALLWKFLSEPKRIQASRALTVSRRQHWKRSLGGAKDRGRIPLDECKNGHKYDNDNTRINRNGSRDCRACHRERTKRNYRSRKVLTHVQGDHQHESAFRLDRKHLRGFSE